MKKIILLFVAAFFVTNINAQTVETLEELKAMKAEKATAAAALQAEADALQAKIDKFPGWKTKLAGTLGGNFNGFDNWFASENINSSTNSFVFDAFGSLRYDSPKQFLYNDAILALGRLTTDNNTNVEDDEVTSTVPNKLNLSSLYGYKIWNDVALSAGLQYNTGLLGDVVVDSVTTNSIFNNPGDLDLGIGLTWTPSQIPDFYLMVHPLNYHWKFGDNPDFASAAGAKIKAGYAREIFAGISWISNLEGFYAYGDPGINELTMVDRPSASWYEWTNTFAFNVWRGIGVGVTYGLRKADSEILDTQSRYSVGLSYTL